MNKMKKMSILWFILSVLLIGSLTAIGVLYKQKSKKYKKLEEKLVEITKKYTSTDFNYPINSTNIIITYDELKEKKLINKLEVDNNKCNGYVEVVFNNITKYKAYIDCNVYKTHNYNSSKAKK